MYCRFNIHRELKEAARERRAVVDVGVLLHLALADYPRIQRAVDRALGTKMHRD